MGIYSLCQPRSLNDLCKFAVKSWDEPVQRNAWWSFETEIEGVKNKCTFSSLFTYWDMLNTGCQGAQSTHPTVENMHMEVIRKIERVCTSQVEGTWALAVMGRLLRASPLVWSRRIWQWQTAEDCETGGKTSRNALIFRTQTRGPIRVLFLYREWAPCLDSGTWAQITDAVDHFQLLTAHDWIVYGQEWMSAIKSAHTLDIDGQIIAWVLLVFIYLFIYVEGFPLCISNNNNLAEYACLLYLYLSSNNFYVAMLKFSVVRS